MRHSWSKTGSCFFGDGNLIINFPFLSVVVEYLAYSTAAPLIGSKVFSSTTVPYKLLIFGSSEFLIILLVCEVSGGDGLGGESNLTLSIIAFLLIVP